MAVTDTHWLNVRDKGWSRTTSCIAPPGYSRIGLHRPSLPK